MKVRITNAMIVGITAAILSCMLIYSSETKISLGMFYWPMLYWFACGLVFHLIDAGSKKIIRAIPFTVFLNFPWYVEESVKQHNASLILLLISESIVMGIIIGFVSMKLDKKVSPN